MREEPFTAGVRQLYKELLGREADASGLKHWSELAARSGSLDPVRAGSEEYRSKKSRSGFVLCRGPTGFEPCDAEGHSIGQPLNTIDAACAAVQALGVHVPADGD
jgi:hypothetical protein